MMINMNSYDRINKIICCFSKKDVLEIGKINKKVFTRKRILPFDKFCMCILVKKGETLNMELNNFFKDINYYKNCISKQDFSKQRTYIDPQIFNILNHNYVSSIYDDNKYDTLKGYIVTAIDGSVIEIPNTTKLQEEYGSVSSNNDDTARKAARAEASGIFDVLNDIMIDAKIDKYSISEKELAKNNIKEMLKILKDKKVIIIFDRGYASLELIYLLDKLGIKYLFRLRNDMYLKEKNGMTSKDQDVKLKATRDRLRQFTDKNLKKEVIELGKINTRFIIHKLNTQEDEFLATNLSKDEFSSKEIGELYYKRWNIEKSYDVIKNKLEIENFSGKRKIVIEQDFYSQILVLNMLYDVKNETNKNEVIAKKEKGCKYDYKLNINILAGFLKILLIEIYIEKDELKKQELHKEFIKKIKRYLVPIKPNRKNPRNKYLGNNKYRINLRRNI